ncbi:polymeric immunoglobulin receptor isoform X1 [Salmo trutta]|uniref:polymeric immunoglobulin receptor isoform X1 n=1 Tax=Salmo trutta TaxID=8032 RepID=UPI001132005C|nr:polymeric immunoglobulin receptor-like isoform X1 [Salmo trutta]
MGLNKITGRRENVFFVQKFSGLQEISERISQEICSSAEDRGQQVVHVPPPGPKNSNVTDSQVTLYRGQSLSALCPYDQRYKEDVKYWCRVKGELDCATIVRTDFPLRRGDVSITDDPSQHVFTVTMQNLQTQDTGEYVCAVDNGRNPLYMASLSLTVTAGFPDVSVRSNMVSGKEGNSTTAECLYSDIMDDSEKMWCRNGTPAGNWSSCLTAEGERASQDRMDLIINTWSRTFTVTMRHLEMNDTDWYWCIAGDKQIPVYISVLNATNTSISPPTMNLITFPLGLTLRATEDDNSRFSSWNWERYLEILLKSAVGLLFLACTILAALVMRDYQRMQSVLGSIRSSQSPVCQVFERHLQMFIALSVLL